MADGTVSDVFLQGRQGYLTGKAQELMEQRYKITGVKGWDGGPDLISLNLIKIK